jgi:hypothetical protein
VTNWLDAVTDPAADHWRDTEAWLLPGEVHKGSATLSVGGVAKSVLVGDLVRLAFTKVAACPTSLLERPLKARTLTAGPSSKPSRAIPEAG